MIFRRMLARSRHLSDSSCVLIAGAGWSAAAGLPLASELFHEFEGPRVLDWSDSGVMKAYRQWRRENPRGQAEQFIASAYAEEVRVLDAPLTPKSSPSPAGQLEFDLGLEDERWHEYRMPWGQVAAYIQRRLAAPAASTRSYRHNPYRPALLRRTISPAQADFWNALLERTTVRAVATLNYDLTLEQTIGIAPNLIPGSPGFYYAGMSARVRPVNSPYARDRSADPTPSGVIPLTKLHGSLNWTLTAEGVEVFADVRPAFRHYGSAAIVPPLPEKQIPSWLWPIWSCAARELCLADEWVVVGYSLPPYDHEIKEMLHGSARRVKTIRIYDPFASEIADRWQAIAPQASIETFPGVEPGFYGRGATSGRLGRDERERRRQRALRDPRVRRAIRRADPDRKTTPRRIAA
jgi:hypothetical protein